MLSSLSVSNISRGVADVSVYPELHEIEIERIVVTVVLHFSSQFNSTQEGYGLHCRNL